MTDAELLDETCEIVRSDACISGKNIAVDLQPGLFIPHIGGQAPAVACDMPTYVARIDRDGKTLLERVDVTVEVVEEGRWRGRFVLPAGTRLPRQTELGLAFADGRRGRAHLDHRAKPVCSPIAG